jgi:L-threonylcarbamoyladenylate synthase
VPRLTVDPANAASADWPTITAWLRAGGAVAFPTDTFYGLAVDPTSATAVATLFALKGRPAESALPFVGASRAQVEAWSGPLAGDSARLADRFWPGPLTLVVGAPPGLTPGVLDPSGTVAIRVPDHAVARALAGAWGTPLPATSANRSGQAPARVVGELGAMGEAPAVLVVDAGAAPGGAPSTIVDARGRTPRLLREGAIGWKRVLDFLQG